jgi:hypothetical protein
MTEPIIERGWTEALHPRAAGKFAPKGSAGTHAPAQPATAASKGGKGHKAAGGKGGADNQSLSYNGRTGAGYGSKNGDQRVHALQAELNRLGFADGSGKALKGDGKLGPRTTAAIKRAQRALGLKPDGIATPALLSKLKSAKKTTTHTATPKKAVKRMPHKAAHKPAKKPAFGKQSGPAAQTPSASAKKAAYRKNVSAA